VIKRKILFNNKLLKRFDVTYYLLTRFIISLLVINFDSKIKCGTSIYLMINFSIYLMRILIIMLFLSGNIVEDNYKIIIALSNDEINKYGDEKCVICIDYYKIGDNIKYLNCDHFYHYECLEN